MVEVETPLAMSVAGLVEMVVKDGLTGPATIAYAGLLATKELASADVSTLITYEPAKVGFVAESPKPARTVIPAESPTTTGDVMVTLVGSLCVGVTPTKVPLTE